VLRSSNKQVDTFGLADPYVCVSAISVAGSENTTHDAKIKQAHASKTGQWLIKPQGTTKTVKNELNPTFEEDFVLDSTLATQNTLAEEIRGQEVVLLVSVHDWNRTSSDVLMGSFRIKMAANDKGRPKKQIHVLQNEAGTSVTDKSGTVSTVVLSVTYDSEASPASPAPQNPPVVESTDSCTKAEIVQQLAATLKAQELSFKKLTEDLSDELKAVAEERDRLKGHCQQMEKVTADITERSGKEIKRLKDELKDELDAILEQRDAVLIDKLVLEKEVAKQKTDEQKANLKDQHEQELKDQRAEEHLASRCKARRLSRLSDKL
jgi:hypothetical protein